MMSNFTYHWYDFVGNIGIVLILWAYFSVQRGKLSATEARFNLMNLCGAVLILVSLCYSFNLSSFLIEIAWISISLYGLWKYRKT